VKSC